MKKTGTAVCLVVAIAALAFAGCSNGAANLGGSSTGNTHSSVVQSQGQTAATTTTTESSSGQIAVVGQGFTQLPPDSIGNSYVTAGVVLQWNSNNKIAEEIQLTLTFLDAGGTVVKSDNETVAAMWPGQTAAVSFEGQVSGAVSMKVQTLVTQTQAQTNGSVTLTTSGVNTTNPDGFGEQTTGTITTNATKDLQEVKATAIYYNLAGAIVGGDYTYVNFIPAGGSTSFQISGTNVVPSLAATLTKVYGSVSGLTLAQASGNSG